MPHDKLLLTPKPPKGEDEYQTFSVRLKKDMVIRLEKMSSDLGYSRNELISVLLNYGLNECVIDTGDY